MIPKVWFLILTSLLISACSINRVLVKPVHPLVRNMEKSLYEENDLQLAEQALANNVVLLEGLLKTFPDDEQLILAAIKAYSGYALGFCEDRQPQRARDFYLRARDLGLKLLRKDKDFAQAEQQSVAALEKVVSQYSREKVAALFWTGFSWAGYILLSLDEPQALADLPEVEVLMRRVEQVQADYFFGAVYLFWGAVYGVKPPMMGGNPEKSRQYFQKNFELNQQHFLLAYVYAARFYARTVLDEALFDQWLQHVLEAKVKHGEPDALLNRIAQEKATLLLKQKQEWF